MRYLDFTNDFRVLGVPDAFFVRADLPSGLGGHDVFGRCANFELHPTGPRRPRARRVRLDSRRPGLAAPGIVTP